jgi:hypothetical protein
LTRRAIGGPRRDDPTLVLQSFIAPLARDFQAMHQNSTNRGAVGICVVQSVVRQGF